MPEYASNTQYSEYNKVLNIAGFSICKHTTVVNIYILGS